MKTIQSFFALVDGKVDPLKIPYRLDTLEEYITTASKTVFGALTAENAEEANTDLKSLAIAKSQLQGEKMKYEKAMMEIPKKLAEIEAKPPSKPKLTTPLQIESDGLTARLGGPISPKYKSPSELEIEHDMMGKIDTRTEAEKQIDQIHKDAKKQKEQYEKTKTDILHAIDVTSWRASTIQKTLDSLRLVQDKIDKLPSGRATLMKHIYLRRRQALREAIIPRKNSTLETSRDLGVLITVYMASHHIDDPELRADAEILFQYAQPLNSKKDIAKNIKAMQQWCEANPEKVTQALDVYLKKQVVSAGRRSNIYQQI